MDPGPVLFDPGPTGSAAPDETGLSAVSVWSYRHHRGARETAEAGAGRARMVRVMRLHLPLFLQQDTWRRHEYSLRDVAMTLRCFSPLHLWQLGAWEKIMASNSAIKASCASDDSLIYGGRAIIHEKLVKHFQKTYAHPSAHDVLTRPNDPQAPPLPVHRLGAEQFAAYRALLPAPEGNPLLARRRYARALVWRGITVVPVDYEEPPAAQDPGAAARSAGADQPYLLMARVISRATYALHYGDPQSIAAHPQMIEVGGEDFCVTEEAFYFAVGAPVAVPRRKRSRKRSQQRAAPRARKRAKK